MQVHLMRVHHLRLLENLPPQDVDQVDRDSDVTRNELVDGEGHKRCPTIEDDDESRQDKGNVCTPRQKRIAVRHNRPRNTLGFHPAKHEVVRHQDANPVQGTEDSDKGHKVAEDSSGILGCVHEAQADEERGQSNSRNRHTLLVSAVEDGRSLVIFGQRPNGTRSEIDVRIGGGDGEDQ